VAFKHLSTNLIRELSTMQKECEEKQVSSDKKLIPFNCKELK